MEPKCKRPVDTFTKDMRLDISFMLCYYTSVHGNIWLAGYMHGVWCNTIFYFILCIISKSTENIGVHIRISNHT